MSKKKQYEEVAFKEFKPKTKGQHDYIRAIAENQIIFCVGPAGSGKSYLSSAMACQYLAEKKIESIVITRPVVDVGNPLGFSPGTVDQKMEQYVYPILFSIEDIFGKERTLLLRRENKIRIVPLTYMRGYTFDNSFVIADEMSNSSKEEMKLLLTRIGKNSKMVITGDLKQSDLRFDRQGALEDAIKKLDGIDNIAIIKLYQQDIVRNPLIAKILERL